MTPPNTKNRHSVTTFPTATAIIKSEKRTQSRNRTPPQSFPPATSYQSPATNAILKLDPSKNMLETNVETQPDVNPQETSEWIEAFDGVVEEGGSQRASYLLTRLIDHAAMYGVETPHHLTTPYVNTIPVEDEVPYPGDREIERRIKSLIRWNAMAMVVRANRSEERRVGKECRSRWSPY